MQAERDGCLCHFKQHHPPMPATHRAISAEFGGRGELLSASSFFFFPSLYCLGRSGWLIVPRA